MYQHAKRQMYQPATPELVTGFKEKMEFIRRRYKHNAKTVDSCLSGMGDPPTLLEVLTAAFVVNGGVLFKHGDQSEEEAHDEELELNELMQEIQELSRGTTSTHPPSESRDGHAASTPATGIPEESGTRPGPPRGSQSRDTAP